MNASMRWRSEGLGDRAKAICRHYRWRSVERLVCWRLDAGGELFRLLPDERRIHHRQGLRRDGGADASPMLCVGSGASKTVMNGMSSLRLTRR